MLDHLTLLVTDYEASKNFYLGTLAPLGYAIIMEVTREQVPDLPVERFAGLGAGKPDLWLRPAEAVTPSHVAFHAATRAEVDACYKAALKVGGKDNGAPGLRPHYHATYYGAFVTDPDGYNIEVVCHSPE